MGGETLRNGFRENKMLQESYTRSKPRDLFAPSPPSLEDGFNEDDDDEDRIAGFLRYERT